MVMMMMLVFFSFYSFFSSAPLPVSYVALVLWCDDGWLVEVFWLWLGQPFGTETGQTGKFPFAGCAQIGVSRSQQECLENSQVLMAACSLGLSPWLGSCMTFPGPVVKPSEELNLDPVGWLCSELAGQVSPQ
jgi:hypothetical protein